MSSNVDVSSAWRSVLNGMSVARITLSTSFGTPFPINDRTVSNGSGSRPRPANIVLALGAGRARCRKAFRPDQKLLRAFNYSKLSVYRFKTVFSFSTVLMSLKHSTTAAASLKSEPSVYTPGDTMQGTLARVQDNSPLRLGSVAQFRN